MICPNDGTKMIVKLGSKMECPKCGQEDNELFT